MEYVQFTSIMPYIISDLIEMIITRQNVSDEEAIKRLYASKLYAALEQEDTKVWQYSTHMLYSLFEQEQNTGTIQYPDV